MSLYICVDKDKAMENENMLTSDRHKTKSILIIDDYKMFVEGVKAFLENAGYNVLYATNIEEAKKQIAENKNISLIISDYNLGKNAKNGLHFLSFLMQHNKKIPMLLLTVYNNPELILNAISLGVKGFMLKDNCTEELLLAIKAIAEKKLFLCEEVLNTLKNYSTKNKETFLQSSVY